MRVCDEIEGAHTWDVMGRGIMSRAITDLGETVGIVGNVHRVRQVRSRLPDRGALRERQVRCGNDEEASVPPIPANDAKGGGAMTQDQEIMTREARWLRKEGFSGEEEGPSRHHMARRLFRLPYVFLGHGRATRRSVGLR